MRWLAVNCILLAYVAIAAASDTRSKRDLSYWKNLISSTLFGSSPSPAPVLISDENNVKLFRIPGFDNILVRAVPKSATPISIVEVNSTPGIVENYLGTETPNQTIEALKGIKNLISTGIIGLKESATNLLKPKQTVYVVPFYPQPPKVPLVPVPIPAVPEVVVQDFVPPPVPVEIPEIIAEPLPLKYYYRQRNLDGTTTTWFSKDGHEINVEVTETGLPMPPPPPMLVERVKFAFGLPKPFLPPLPMSGIGLPRPVEFDVPRYPYIPRPAQAIDTPSDVKVSFKNTGKDVNAMREPGLPQNLIDQIEKIRARLRGRYSESQFDETNTFIDKEGHIFFSRLLPRDPSISSAAQNKPFSVEKLNKEGDSYGSDNRKPEKPEIITQTPSLLRDEMLSPNSPLAMSTIPALPTPIADRIEQAAKIKRPPGYEFKIVNGKVYLSRFVGGSDETQEQLEDISQPIGDNIADNHCKNSDKEACHGRDLSGSDNPKPDKSKDITRIPAFPRLKESTTQNSPIAMTVIPALPVPIANRIEEVAAGHGAKIKRPHGYEFKIVNGKLYLSRFIGSTNENEDESEKDSPKNGAEQKPSYSYTQLNSDGGYTLNNGDVTVTSTYTKNKGMNDNSDKIPSLPHLHDNVNLSFDVKVDGAADEGDQPVPSYSYVQMSHNNSKPFTVVEVGNESSNGDSAINIKWHNHVNPDGSKYPCPYGDIHVPKPVETVQAKPEFPKDYVYIPPEIAEEIPERQVHVKDDVKVSGHYTYQQVTQNGVYTNEDGKVEVKENILPSKSEETVTKLPETSTKSADKQSGSFNGNPIIVSDVKNYSYTQKNADGSSIVQSSSGDSVSIDVKGSKTSSFADGNRGDIPESNA